MRCLLCIVFFFVFCLVFVVDLLFCRYLLSLSSRCCLVGLGVVGVLSLVLLWSFRGVGGVGYFALLSSFFVCVCCCLFR